MKSNRIFFLFLIPSLSLVFYSFLIRKKTNDLFFDLEKKRQILQKLIDSEPDSLIQDSAPELKAESFDLMLKNCGITSFSFSSGKSEHNGTYVFDCEHNKLVSVIEELNCEFLPFYPADFFFQKKEKVYSVKAQIVNKERHFKVSENSFCFLRKPEQKEKEKKLMISPALNSFENKKTTHETVEKENPTENKKYIVLGSVLSEDDFIYIKPVSGGSIKKIKKENFNFKEFTCNEND